ncbi:MAG: 16S rRNA (cytosine(1402)-N(4))-methyltransferase RsmH [Armatimonadetes bacterium]|nr:16S rRNA (cytosine(1402)-N(4))-methyltransferase RsmH [Armatimonadota bacterium]
MRARRLPGLNVAAATPDGDALVGPAPRHVPVLLDPVLRDLCPRPGAVMVDGTLGLGGHSQKLIEAIRPGGTLVGLDWDADMLSLAIERLGAPEGVQVHLFHEDFRQVKSVLERLGLAADGILLDLGLNSAQLQRPERGFSFAEEGVLDMRQDVTRNEPASALLNKMGQGQLEEAIQELGGERWAKAIARKIVEFRRGRALRTTQDLVDCVLAAIPPKARDKRIHPATRTFQAIRILVNRELEGLEEALRDAASALAPNGVLCVIAYHSGEDRIVKRTFRDLANEGYLELHRKPVVPDTEEERRNPRSRSAKLRSLRRSA